MQQFAIVLLFGSNYINKRDTLGLVVRALVSSIDDANLIIDKLEVMEGPKYCHSILPTWQLQILSSTFENLTNKVFQSDASELIMHTLYKRYETQTMSFNKRNGRTIFKEDFDLEQNSDDDNDDDDDDDDDKIINNICNTNFQIPKELMCNFANKLQYITATILNGPHKGNGPGIILRNAFESETSAEAWCVEYSSTSKLFTCLIIPFGLMFDIVVSKHFCVKVCKNILPFCTNEPNFSTFA